MNKTIAELLAAVRQIDNLRAENAKLREDFKFQAALTEALLPYQEEAVALREVLREFLSTCYCPNCMADASLNQSVKRLNDRARALLEGK
jgi:hypothetical protein